MINSPHSSLSPKFSALLAKPVELSPWAYLWRRDRAVQEKPEAEFIPHRLKRLDGCYRVAKADLGEEQLRPWCYDQDDIMADFLPAPANPLLTGLLWVGGMTDYTVELVWEEGAAPNPADVEVRTYPTAWGWFGWTVDKRLTCEDTTGNTWVYPHPEGDTIDYSYNTRVKAQTEMIAVFAPEGTPMPTLRVTGDSLGCWKQLTFTVEWGFAEGLPDYAGFSTHVALADAPTFDSKEKKATFTCLYTDTSRFGLDSRFTVVTDEKAGLGATVLLRELAKEPICVPEAGLFFCPIDQPMTAKQYMEAQKAQGKRHIRERVAEHPEAHDWEELLEKVRLWRCPDDTEPVPFPKAPPAAAGLHVPDKRWEEMYELAIEQLRGPHMWGHLASEVFRVTAAMEMLGLNDYADKVYDYFLASPGVMHDGDFSDAEGSFEWAKQMVHGMCYAHEGSHFSTGGILYSMMHCYLMTGDEKWVRDRLPRLKKAADWIIRMRRTYMEKEAPNRELLHVKGLMPPAFLGDYALPASDWRWYYNDDASQFQGLNYFARVLREIGDEDAAHYTAEVEDFRTDLMEAVKREALLAPVRRNSDGMSRSFIPRMAYAGGLLLYGEETNVPQFANGINDLFQGALPLADVGAPMDPCDRRMVGTVDAMEESGLRFNLTELEHLAHPTATAEDKADAERLARESAAAKRTHQPPESEDVWFWNTFSNLPKIAHNSNVYLREDDIPSFLRFFFNHAIVMVGSNGKMWEHAHPDIYVPCENPDNGTAAWFVENYRFMLLMEEQDALWIAKGTPRAWMEDGKTISVEHAPTLFGNLSYEIRSAVKEGSIAAEITVPTRKLIAEIKLRLRHPDGKKIMRALVNGAEIAPDADGETLTLLEPNGNLSVIAFY